MTINVGIGVQSFAELREGNYFYIDKTSFIKEWWESGDSVTLITRPRRFGKTLNMSMVEQFFSIGYAGRSDLFEGLSIWNEKKYQDLQGTYPVISLSFANIKEKDFPTTRKKICQLLANLYAEHPEKDDAIILEFKVKNKRREETLEDTLAAALKQIEEKQYAAKLAAKGFPKKRIRRYGFAFEGKNVLIGE